MGVVIVGPSGGGKSTLWRMLKTALGKTGKVVKQYTMNPKAMPRHQLLGRIDMDTREWSDGVLTNSARQVVREPRGMAERGSQAIILKLLKLPVFKYSNFITIRRTGL